MTENLSAYPDIRERMEIFDRNYSDVRERIAAAAAKAGRKAEDIRLLAATKTIPTEVINHAVKQGIDLIGENRVQEFLSKESELDKNVEKHMIGRLQTNKVRQIVGKVSMIHSVDSVHLANEISKRSIMLGIKTDVLVEVNVGNEESKSGISYDDAQTFLSEISQLEGIRVEGLMTIPPLCLKSDENIKFFEKMNKLFIDISGKKMDNINMKYLSMGMSADFENAILCGANIVRLGTVLFGKRDYSGK